MPSLAPIAFLLAALAAGGGLAAASRAMAMPTGRVGAGIVIVWAIAMRRRWAIQETNDVEPGAPERVLWLRLAGVALILGHLIVAILIVGDGLRLGSGNSLAIDSWTMVVGHQIAAFLFRSDIRQQDERHAPIVARGVRTGFSTQIVLQIALAVWMVVLPVGPPPPMSPFVLANVLIVLLLVSYAAMLLIQLVAYRQDARDSRSDG